MKPPVVDVAYHDLGGVGPVLVMFHANSLCGRVFKPMVQLLGRHFRCIALDAPGQGSSPPWPSHLPISFDGIIDCMHAKVLSLGLQGSYVFGHSMGGSIALGLQQRQPGLFRALYVFEPPSGTPRSLAATQPEPSCSGAFPPPPSAGSQLAASARRRRPRWPSLEQAAAQLRPKPPYSTWHPDCFQAFLQAGFKTVALDAPELPDLLLAPRQPPGPLSAAPLLTPATPAALKVLSPAPGTKGQHSSVAAPGSPSASGTSQGKAAGAQQAWPQPAAAGGGKCERGGVSGPPAPEDSPGTPTGTSPKEQPAEQPGSPDLGTAAQPPAAGLGEGGGVAAEGGGGVGSGGVRGGAGAGVELCCSRAMELAVYLLVEPPEPLAPLRLHCPLAWAVGRDNAGVHGRLTRLASHSVQELGCAALRRFPQLSHFGPQEEPQAVAADVLDFFTALPPCTSPHSSLAGPPASRL
ncbi:hypothetical protein QJQ45_006320 [Haematococcus lacustris]|nr:hypothetical protein QJQ45_006320 [Haematococcus lacustris]